MSKTQANVPFTLQSRKILYRQFTQVADEKLRLGKRILALTAYWWVRSDAVRCNPESEHRTGLTACRALGHTPREVCPPNAPLGNVSVMKTDLCFYLEGWQPDGPS